MKRRTFLGLTGGAAAASLVSGCSLWRPEQEQPRFVPGIQDPNAECRNLGVAYNEFYPIFTGDDEPGRPLGIELRNRIIGDAALQAIDAYPAYHSWVHTETGVRIAVVTAYVTDKVANNQPSPGTTPDPTSFWAEATYARKVILGKAEEHFGRPPSLAKVGIEVHRGPAPGIPEPTDYAGFIGILVQRPQC